MPSTNTQEGELQRQVQQRPMEQQCSIIVAGAPTWVGVMCSTPDAVGLQPHLEYARDYSSTAPVRPPCSLGSVSGEFLATVNS